MTERPDGSTRAIQPQSYFDSQQFATAVYQSELKFRLRNLGYQIEAGKSGAPDIKGYTSEYLEVSSPRRQQIEEAVARSGFSGPEATQIAAHNTRDKKDILSPSEILAAHRKIANEFGNQSDRVVAEARERTATLEQVHVQDAPRRAQEAATFAKDRGFEREGVTDERAIMRDVLRRGMGDAGKPFEQMQLAGMQTSQLDQIMRQKDPELLRAVEYLSKIETSIGLMLLQQQDRVTEIPDNPSALRPSPGTTSPSRRTRRSSRPITPAVRKSTMQSALNCRHPV
jgi:uncharacterized protein YdaT